MKYIRTKDKIVEVPEDKQHLRFLQDFKQADTIEELCDEFVCESNEKGNDFRCHYHDIVRLKYDSFYAEYREHYNFYGSIYIKGKGLIHVAKMNNIGELELL